MQKVYVLLFGFLIVSGSALGDQESPEIKRTMRIIAHAQTVDRVLEKLDRSVTNGQFAVSNKKTVSGHLTQARTIIQDLFKDKSDPLKPLSDELSFLHINTSVDKLIATWSAHPEFVPSDDTFELAVHYVKALTALFHYVKNYDAEQLSRELGQPDSGFVSAFCTYSGVAAAIGACTLNDKARQKALQQLYVLSILIDIVKQNVIADKIPVSDKKLVAGYLTKVHEILVWPLQTAHNFTKYESLRPSIEQAIKELTDITENQRGVIRIVIKEIVRKNYVLSSMTLKEPFIDFICLMGNCLGSSEAALFESVA